MISYFSVTVIRDPINVENSQAVIFADDLVGKSCLPLI